MLQRRVTGLTVFPRIGEESVLLAGGGGGGVTGNMWCCGWVRSKDVTGLAVLPGVNGEVLRAGYGWEGYTEATWRGWVKDVLGLQLFLVFMVKYHVQGVVR